MPDNRVTSFTPERPIAGSSSAIPSTVTVPANCWPTIDVQNVNSRVITSSRSFSPMQVPNVLPRRERVERGNGEYSGTAQARVFMPSWQDSPRPGTFTPATPQATAIVLPQVSLETDIQLTEREFQRDRQTGQILLYSDSLRTHLDQLLSTTQLNRSGLSQTAKKTAIDLTLKVNFALDHWQDDTALLRSTRLVEMKNTVHEMVQSSLHDKSGVKIPFSLLDASASLANISLAMQNLTTREGEILAQHQVERKKVQDLIDDARAIPGTGSERYALVQKRDSLDKIIEGKLFNNSALIARRLLFIMNSSDISLHKRYEQALTVCQQLETGSHLLPLFRAMMDQTGFYAAIEQLRMTLPSRPVVDNIQTLADDLGKAFKRESRIQASLACLEISSAIGNWLKKLSDNEKVCRDETLNWHREEELNDKYQQRESMLKNENALLEMQEQERLWAEQKIKVDLDIHTSEDRSLEGHGEYQSAMTGLGTTTIQVKVPRKQLYKYWQHEQKGEHAPSEQLLQGWAREQNIPIPPLSAQGTYSDPETGERYQVKVNRHVNAVTATPARKSHDYSQYSTHDALNETVRTLRLKDFLPNRNLQTSLPISATSRPELPVALFNTGALSAQSGEHRQQNNQPEVRRNIQWPQPSFASTLTHVSACNPLASQTFSSLARQTSGTDNELQTLFRDINLAKKRHARALFPSTGPTNQPSLPERPHNMVSIPQLSSAITAFTQAAPVPTVHFYRGRNDRWENYMLTKHDIRTEARGADVYHSIPTLGSAIKLLNDIVNDVYHQIINPQTFHHVRQALAYCTGIPAERITGKIYGDFSRQIYSLMQQVRTFLPGGKNENQWVKVRVPEDSPLFAATMPNDPECRIWLSQYVASSTLPELTMTLAHEFSHMAALEKPTEDYFYVTRENYNSYNIYDIQQLMKSLFEEVEAIANNTALRAEYIQQTKDDAGPTYCFAQLAKTFGDSSASGAAISIENDDWLRYELMQGTADLLMLTIMKLGNRTLIAGLPPQERNSADPLAVLAAIEHFDRPEEAQTRLEEVFRAMANPEIELFEAQLLIIKLATVALPFPLMTANWLEKKGQELPLLMARLYAQNTKDSAMVLGLINGLLTPLMENGHLSATYVQPCIFPMPYTVQIYDSEYDHELWQDTLISNWVDLLCSYQRKFTLTPKVENLFELIKTLVEQSAKYNSGNHSTYFYLLLADKIAYRMNETLADIPYIDDITDTEPVVKKRRVYPQPDIDYQNEETLTNLAILFNFYIAVEDPEGNTLRAYNPAGNEINPLELPDYGVEKSDSDHSANSTICIIRERQRSPGENIIYYDAVGNDGNIIVSGDDDHNLLQAVLIAITPYEPTEEVINQLINDLHDASF